MTYDMAPVSVQSIINEVITLIAPQAKAREITLSHEPAPASLIVGVPARSTSCVRPITGGASAGTEARCAGIAPGGAAPPGAGTDTRAFGAPPGGAADARVELSPGGADE